MTNEKIFDFENTCFIERLASSIITTADVVSYIIAVTSGVVGSRDVICVGMSNISGFEFTFRVRFPWQLRIKAIFRRCNSCDCSNCIFDCITFVLPAHQQSATIFQQNKIFGNNISFIKICCQWPKSLLAFVNNFLRQKAPDQSSGNTKFSYYQIREDVDYNDMKVIIRSNY
ncbi:hypothetical protein Bhyg_11766 [Pseudolycoriella hygida]|uniref:Uncharacterized protein n=1 Tax=Pseudolycoriella hygida TaxID=35572 RepID=A0A9Q0MYI9_9DIPT|nr:hypothetical protein Bhyg_11766 [Pseudolycoriella hygida]